MPTYGLKYQSQFHSQSDENNPSKLYTLQFLFKDYTGGTTSIAGADTTVIQKCTVDDPVAPIKGQSLEISLLNRGNTPITAFQSDDDDGVQVKLLGDANEVLFIGFLVQDDFYEGMVDYAHPIILSANDGLGLLKGVVLSDASVRRAFDVTFLTVGVDVDNIYIYSPDTAFYPQVGDTIEIQGIIYTVEAAQAVTAPLGTITYNWLLRVTPDTPGFVETADTVYLTGEVDLIQRNSLLSLIAVCLGQTNLSLITNIFLTLYEYTQDNTKCTLEQTILDSQLFISGETYDDCYTALTKILTAFNCTLFQANGQWNIVHWFEAIPKESWSYPNNALPGFVYDETWTAIGTTVLNNNFFIGATPQLTRPIFQLTQGALRGYKFSRKQFDYKFPKYLLKNYDLLILGDLIRTYVDGLNTVSEYVATNWLAAFGSPYADRFIRVVVETATATEVERYLVVRGEPFDAIRAVPSDQFEANEGDKIKLSFTTRTTVSQPPSFGAVFALRLTDGTLYRYVNELPVGNGDWLPTVGFVYPFTNNTNQWTTIEIASSQIPFSGLICVFLAENIEPPYSSTRETHYKDIRLEYITFVTDSTKVTGHIHTQERITGPKLNSDEEIVIDDSPRNPIAGTLFLPRLVGLLQARTTFWRYPPDANGWKLGELTTLEELTWRQKTRSKLEGGFIGNYQTSVISLLTMAITDFDTSKNYTFGLLTIDYKRNQFSGTLWELYDTEDAFFDPDYEFKYIYSTT